MDIHKPKPFHNLRELGSEIVVIVIGVLIALAFEQAVETLQWHEKVVHAETGLRQDAHEVLFDMLERIEIQQCLDRRLVFLKDKLLASNDAWAPVGPFITKGPPAGSAYAHPMEPWPRTGWQNAVAGTTAMHLPEQELTSYSDLFQNAERAANDQALEHEQSSELNLLGSPIPLTTDVKVTFLRIIEAERGRNRLIAYEARNSLDDFKALGLDLASMRAEVHKGLFYRACVADGLV